MAWGLLVEALYPRLGPAGTCETRLAHLMCPVNHLNPPEIKKLIPVWGEEVVIYTECWGTNPQYTVSLSFCLVTHWFSPHHHHLHHQLHLSSFFLLEKEQVEPILGRHYASFLIRSPGFLKLFFNSPLGIFGSFSWSPAYRLTIKRTIWSKLTQASW